MSNPHLSLSLVSIECRLDQICQYCKMSAHVSTPTLLYKMHLFIFAKHLHLLFHFHGLSFFETFYRKLRPGCRLLNFLIDHTTLDYHTLKVSSLIIIDL